jgi:antitoxin CptB
VITAEQDLNRLRWRCRRGMRELEALLIAFVDFHYATAPGTEQDGFHALICLPDPEILGLLTGRVRSEDPGIAAVVERIVRERVSRDA